MAIKSTYASHQIYCIVKMLEWHLEQINVLKCYQRATTEYIKRAKQILKSQLWTITYPAGILNLAPRWDVKKVFCDILWSGLLRCHLFTALLIAAGLRWWYELHDSSMALSPTGCTKIWSNISIISKLSVQTPWYVSVSAEVENLHQISK